MAVIRYFWIPEGVDCEGVSALRALLALQTTVRAGILNKFSKLHFRTVKVGQE
jgi:hypothetical protein